VKRADYREADVYKARRYLKCRSGNGVLEVIFCVGIDNSYD
jgi:hypothetical protein